MTSISAVVVNREGSGPITVGVERRPTPSLRPGGLLVRPEYVGACGTDLELLDGHFEQECPVRYPVVLGHEWSGVVVDVADDVAGFSSGDLIVGHGALGNNHWFGLTDDGAMAELFSVSAKLCHRVPAGVSAQRAALVEPLACVVEAVQKVGGVDSSHAVAVFGCGTLGLAAVGMMRCTGASVVAIDPSQQRRDIASQLGAQATLDPTSEPGLTAALAREVGVEGADLVVEASGSPLAQADALRVAAHSARVLYMGLAHGNAQDVPLRLIQAHDLKVSSSTGAQPSAFPRALRLMSRSCLDLTPAVSKVYGFDAVDAAIASARAPGESGKVMLRP